MAFLKKSGIIFLGLIMLLLTIALLTPKEYGAEAKITINKSNADLFSYLKSLKNQEQYGVWSQKDPNIKKTYKGTDGQVGFIAIWESNHPEVGSGEQEIITITENKRIDFELRFKTPFESIAQAYLTTETIDKNKTEVVWGFKSRMVYPMNLMLLFVSIDEAVAAEFQIGLQNLKNIQETN